MQALGVLAALRPWPVLIVAPATLRLMWAEEVAHHSGRGAYYGLLWLDLLNHDGYTNDGYTNDGYILTVGLAMVKQ